MRLEDVPAELAETLADRMYDDAHDGCDEGCHGTPHSYYAEYARALLAETILPDAYAAAATELEERFQRMREDGEADMRTVIVHVREVLR